jgi:hypothetical protein
MFILAGQSNAQGWQGNAAHYPSADQYVDEQIAFYWVTPGFSSSDGQWTTLQPQGGRFKDGHFGPEVTFARSLKEAGLNPAIFKYTRGATGIAKHWKTPGQGGMYDNMVTEFAKAKGLLEQEGYRVQVRCFIWIQGENDAHTEAMADAFKERLRTLIGDIRLNVTGNPSLPVILGLDEQHPWVTKNPQVIRAQQELAKELDHVVFTSMIGLEKADVSHLTPDGLAEHGRRLFAAYRRLTGLAADER